MRVYVSTCAKYGMRTGGPMGATLLADFALCFDYAWPMPHPAVDMVGLDDNAPWGDNMLAWCATGASAGW